MAVTAGVVAVPIVTLVILSARIRIARRGRDDLATLGDALLIVKSGKGGEAHEGTDTPASDAGRVDAA
jgi:hypothetical protein